MAYLSVKQLREQELEKFNKRYINDYEKARNLINRLYRLSGLNSRLCEYDNDERYCNSKYVNNQHNKEDRMIQRLKNDLKPYGLTIFYPGIYPIIISIETKEHALNTYYYN